MLQNCIYLLIKLQRIYETIFCRKKVLIIKTNVLQESQTNQAENVKEEKSPQGKEQKVMVIQVMRGQTVYYYPLFQILSSRPL